MSDVRIEADSLGPVEIPNDRLWGAQTQRAVEHFRIGHERMPREMIAAFAILKKAAATANHAGGQLGDREYGLIAEACDELLAGKHADMFPLHVWISGSGTQFNMNVNEVIANRVSQLAGHKLGGKTPAHPNDHVNMSQSTNDAFPTAMHIAAATAVSARLLPAVASLAGAIGEKAREWAHIVKIGRTHLQDATPLTLGQEWSGYEAMLREGLGAYRGDPAGRLRRRARRHGGRHRHQRAARLRGGGHRRDRPADRPALRSRAEPVRGAGRA